MEGLGLLFAAVAVLWGAQIWAAHRQARSFMREVNRLRRSGPTAVGVSDVRRVKPKMFVALSGDGTDRVAHAIELKGVTVFSRPQPVPQLEGRNLRELAETAGDSRRDRATAMAARTLLGEEVEPM